MKKRKSKPGRPQKKTRVLTRLVATNVDEKTFSSLVRHCDRNNSTVSEFLRKLIQGGLARS